MPLLARSFETLRWKYTSGITRFTSTRFSRALSITSQGKSISREELFDYTLGRHLVNEAEQRKRRYVRFDVEKLCTVAAAAGGKYSPIEAIEKMEGGFCKALVMRKEDGSEVVAKIPFSIAGPAKYTTASEVAVLEFVSIHTRIPVPKVLAWSSDASNPVGFEYIVMEKAAGQQLWRTWDDMTRDDYLSLVKQLTQLEAELADIQLSASGSLYFRDSLTDGESWVALDRKTDPAGQFCIGPSCERTWLAEGKMVETSLSSFGLALVERGVTSIAQHDLNPTSGPPRGTIDEQIAALNMVKEIVSRLDTVAIFQKFLRPVLWHTDLHMGNIYNTPSDPANVSSIIDWQSIVVSPLYLQTRFPTFLSIDDSYTIGLTELPQLPHDYETMDPDEKSFTREQFRDAQLSKYYEVSTALHNPLAHAALDMPAFMHDLFRHCAEVSSAGAIPLRNCVLDSVNGWELLEFADKCPVRFSDAELGRHAQQLQAYGDYRRVQDMARKWLMTDAEGWVDPRQDFAQRRRVNKEMLEFVVERCAEFNMTAEEVRRVWLFPVEG